VFAGRGFFSALVLGPGPHMASQLPIDRLLWDILPLRAGVLTPPRAATRDSVTGVSRRRILASREGSRQPGSPAVRTCQPSTASPVGFGPAPPAPRVRGGPMCGVVVLPGELGAGSKCSGAAPDSANDAPSFAPRACAPSGRYLGSDHARSGTVHRTLSGTGLPHGSGRLPPRPQRHGRDVEPFRRLHSCQTLASST
jgi:hypothetical protein